MDQHIKQIKIVLTGGGSGGHIIPLLSLAHALKKADPSAQLIYIGWKGDDKAILSGHTELFDEIYHIPAGKFRRYSGESWFKRLTDIRTMSLNARDLSRLAAGRSAAGRILRQTKPSVIFSKGGFVAVPVGLAAKKLGIPIVTHDSDAVPGLANRIIGKYAAVHAVGQKTGSYNYPAGRVVYTGIPVSGNLKPLSAEEVRVKKAELGLPARAQLVVITGGGHGSASLNKMAVAVVPRLLANYPNLYAVHITGAKHELGVKKSYTLDGEAASRLQVLGFSLNYGGYISAADLIVCRAGASTIAELAVLKKPLILVPAPQLADGHQMANARELVANDAAKVVDEKAEPEKFYDEISELLDNPELRRKLGVNLGRQAAPGAASDLAKIILKTAGR